MSIHLRLDPATERKVKKLADDEQRPVSSMIVRIVRLFFERTAKNGRAKS